MKAMLRAGALGIALLGFAGCAAEDEGVEGDELVDIELAPDDTVDPIGGGSSSGGDSCGSPPAGGSDPLQIVYRGNEDKEGDCCWQNYVQKTYRRYQLRYLVCY